MVAVLGLLKFPPLNESLATHSPGRGGDGAAEWGGGAALRRVSSP